MSSKRKKIIGSARTTSQLHESPCITLELHGAELIIAAVRASEGALPLAVTLGQPLALAFPQLETRVAVMAGRVARTGKALSVLLPFPQATSPVARCTCMALPGSTAAEVAVLLSVATEPAALPETVPFSHSADLGAVVESLADGVVIYDLAGDALYYNPAALKMMGWEQAGIDPRTLTTEERMAQYDMRFPDGQPTGATPETMRSALTQEFAEPTEWQMRRLDGSLIYINIRLAPIRDHLTGAVIGAVLIMRDVTSWRQINDIKDEFMSIASHELRAPLQPLLMASRFIQRWISRPERAQDVVQLAEEVARQSKRMARLVFDMLDMTRISAGRFSIQLLPCDIADVVRNVAEEQTNISQREVQILGADQPLPAMADAERLWQVLTNLLSNAIKYSAAPAPVTVRITQNAEAPTPWIRISVQDTGIGIPAENLPRLFERFYRAGVTVQMTPQQQDGLGLGLYISHAIIEAHGGHLWAESVLHTGSTFTIEIPLIPTTVEDDENSQ